MDALFLLQYTCFALSVILALLLLVSKFLQSDVTKEYRKARWLLVFSMLLLAAHYLLQMALGLRSHSDELGTVFNILFYTPVSFLMSCSVTMQISSRQRFRRYAMIGTAGSILEILIFFIGWSVFGHFHADSMRYAMHVLFFISMAYYIYYTVNEILRNNKRIIDDTGGDITPYVRYASSSYLLLSAGASTLVFIIVWRPMLFIAAPLLLLSLLIYVASFAALGFNMSVVDEVLVEDESDAFLTGALDDVELQAAMVDNAVQQTNILNAEAAVPSVNASDYNAPASVVAEEAQGSNETKTVSDAVAAAVAADPVSAVERQMLHVEKVLNQWIAAGGFRDPTINIGRLAQITNLPRAELTLFFYRHLHSTFRSWLSDIRFAAAQRMIHEHPEYSNDTVSNSCGFSSRSQLYRIFSDRVGMSPREWHEKSCGE